MPKVKIDYSNTIFYKIFCLDESINEMYIGHTTNFVQRKHAHKQSCSNTKSSNYKCKLYEVIRNNQGWDNWKMEIIAFHECNDLFSAKKYEQQYFEQYNATLNSIEPLPKPKPIINKAMIEKKEKETIYCNICNVFFSSTKLQDKHNETKKHLKNVEFPIMNLSPKIAKQFICEKCDYQCSKQSGWKKHTMTLKHKNRTKLNDLEQKNNQKSQKIFVCECGKEYSARNSLWYHKKKCSINQEEKEEKETTETPTTNNVIDKEFMVKMFKEMFIHNKDVIDKIMEIMPQIGNNSHNTNSLNTTNNQFNIQMFLNEHCKNAMNLTDFIDTLPITAETYDNTIQNGLTKSMTNLLVNGLSQLDILKRPIHCTDASRKTLYVKDEDTWEKDTELQRLLLGITALAQKQRSNIDKWQDVNEGWRTNENIQTKFTDLIFHTMDDVENNEKETGKIIRAISKNVYLDNEVKNQYI